MVDLSKTALFVGQGCLGSSNKKIFGEHSWTGLGKLGKEVKVLAELQKASSMNSAELNFFFLRLSANFV